MSLFRTVAMAVPGTSHSCNSSGMSLSKTVIASGVGGGVGDCWGWAWGRARGRMLRHEIRATVRTMW